MSPFTVGIAGLVLASLCTNGSAATLTLAGAVPGGAYSIDYKYAPAAAGSVSFTGLAAGDYDVYLLANDAYHVLGQSAFTVIPEPSAAALLRRRR